MNASQNEIYDQLRVLLLIIINKYNKNLLVNEKIILNIMKDSIVLNNIESLITRILVLLSENNNFNNESYLPIILNDDLRSSSPWTIIRNKKRHRRKM